MLSLTLAYFLNDQQTARRLVNSLKSHIDFREILIDKNNEGPTLVEQVNDNDRWLLLLVSDGFLRSPNCMLRLQEVLRGDRSVLLVYVRSWQYDELTDEEGPVQISLADQTAVMHYVNHWEDRYIDLRTQEGELMAIGGSAFANYLRKIRETSTEMEELLYRLQEQTSCTEDELRAEDYKTLFFFADRPRLWEDFRDGSQTTADLSGIPGMGMLNTAERSASPEEEQSTDPLPLGADFAPTLEADNSLTDETVTSLPPVTPEEELSADADTGLASTEEFPLEPDTILEGLDASVVPIVPDAEVIPMPGISPASPPEGGEAPPEPDAEAAEEAQQLIAAAWSAFDANKAAAGLELLAEGRQIFPDHPGLHYNYALLLVSATEDVAASRAQLEALLDKCPDHPDALFLNGELAESSGAYHEARENWEQLSDTEPFYPDLNFRLGTLIEDHFPEEYLDAAAYLRRATKGEEATGVTFFRYARLLAGPIGRQKKAIRQLRKAIKRQPDLAEAHALLGQLLQEQGNASAAENARQTALRLNPALRTSPLESTRTEIPSDDPPVSEALAALKKDIARLEAELAERALANTTRQTPATASQTVFITGATSGIGQATARRLAAAGFRLMLLGRRKERLVALAEELHQHWQTETLILSADVRDRDRIRQLITDLPPAWQNIDVLLNNAGKAKGFDPVHTGNYEHWDEMIDVNLKGLLTLTREVSPRMVARGKGMIINVASTAGKEVYPNGNVYCATKHAVDALTYAMRLDLVKHGIRVGQICPAHVEETEFAVVRFDGDQERARIYEDFQPLRSPDVAEAIHFMVTQPPHVNIMDIVLQGTQQASSTVVDRSGRSRWREEE